MYLSIYKTDIEKKNSLKIVTLVSVVPELNETQTLFRGMHHYYSSNGF